MEAEVLKLARAKLTRQTESHLSAIVERMENWGNGSQMDAASLDLEFHRALWHASGNSYLERTLDSLVRAKEVSSVGSNPASKPYPPW